ncbi:unnamed protein product [Meloidogyne enterolobii]|uniref:Uncharacterized protein n=1 Tax=Meloidogyne enterolobii TaxID=390850 RepID=A0ACB1APD4_MELEN
MVHITAKETEEESEKSSFEATEKVVSSGEMSFEAVPCMFKSRQEDGAEGSLFGLLIRPAIASTSTTTELNNTILINNGVVNNDSGKEMLVATSGNVAIEGNPSSSTLTTNQPNIMQVLPACNNANSIRVNQQQMTSSVIIASKMLQFQQPKGRLIPSASFPLLPAPSGVPPILPKTSKHHHQQKKLKNLLLKSSPKVIPIQPKIAKTTLSTLTKTTIFNKSDGCCSNNNINSLRPEIFAASLHVKI